MVSITMDCAGKFCLVAQSPKWIHPTCLGPKASSEEGAGRSLPLGTCHLTRSLPGHSRTEICVESQDNGKIFFNICVYNTYSISGLYMEILGSPIGINGVRPSQWFTAGFGSIPMRPFYVAMEIDHSSMIFLYGGFLKWDTPSSLDSFFHGKPY